MAQETKIEESGCQLQAFERNRYYFGKKLTVRDFGVEQRYMNEKRHLLNRLVSGAGIICGLGVEPVLDDEEIFNSLEVSPGVALDCCGKEVVLHQPYFTGNISKLDGFPKNFNGGVLYLCLSYDECLREPLPALSNATSCGETCDYNRILEGYKISLTETPPDVASFLALCTPQTSIFKNDSIEVRRMVPRWVNQDELFEIKFIITALEDISSMKVLIKEKYPAAAQNNLTLVKGLSPDFQTPELQLTNLTERDTLEHSYFVQANGLMDDISIDAQIRIEENEFQNASDSSILSIIDEPLIEKVINNYFSETKAECGDCSSEGKIYLAKLNISVTVDGTITNLTSDTFLSFDQYIYDNPLLAKLIACGSNRVGKIPLISVKDSDTADPGETMRAVSIFDLREGIYARRDDTEQGQVNIGVNAGKGISIAEDFLTIGTGKGLGFNAVEHIEAQLGAGLTFNFSDKIAAKIGNGLKFDDAGEEKMEASLGKGVEFTAAGQIQTQLGKGLKFDANAAMEAEVANGIKITSNKIQPDYSAQSAAGKVCEANDPRLSDPRIPKPHAVNHQVNGADQLDVSDLGGELADPQKVVVQHEGNDIAKRITLNFTGEGVTSVEDDPPKNRVNIKIEGGGTAAPTLSGRAVFENLVPGEFKFSPAITPNLLRPYAVQLAIQVELPNGRKGYMTGDMAPIYLEIFKSPLPSIAALIDENTANFEIIVRNNANEPRNYIIRWWATPAQEVPA